jgi:hypothetical protein
VDDACRRLEEAFAAHAMEIGHSGFEAARLKQFVAVVNVRAVRAADAVAFGLVDADFMRRIDPKAIVAVSPSRTFLEHPRMKDFFPQIATTAGLTCERGTRSQILAQGAIVGGIFVEPH